MKLQENQLFANRYKLLQKIGIGGFSEVWKASDEYIPGMTVALKIYSTESSLDKESIELFSGEYMLTKSLKHKHLVEVIYYDIYQQSPYLVMPYYSNGSLAKVLHTNGPLSETEIARLMYEISDALHYLHTQDPIVLHRDIKPDNILIADNGNYLLSDFGISRRVRHTIAKHTGKGSQDSMSLAYSAPERFSRNPQTTPASDIFSLGVMFYQLCTGFLPWEENGGIALLRGAEVPDIPTHYSRKLNQIINQCMEADPAKRPTASQLKEWANAFLSEGYWKINQGKSEEKEKRNKYLLPAAIVSVLLLLILAFAMLSKKDSEDSVARDNGKEQSETDTATSATVMSGMRKDEPTQDPEGTGKNRQKQGPNSKVNKNPTGNPKSRTKPPKPNPQPKDTSINVVNRMEQKKDSVIKKLQQRTDSLE